MTAWFALGAAACAILTWLALRRATALLLIVLATFAVGPQWLLADGASPALVAWLIPAHMLLLLAALLVNGAHYGLRLDAVNWPLIAVLWLLCQTLLLADLDGTITPAALLGAALSLALPLCLVHAALQPGSRARYALLIALLATICVAAGAALEQLEAYSLFSGSKGRGLRLHGASNPGWLAFLSFTGFAIALHEGVRGRRFDFAALALLNVLITLLSGGRMGLVACGIFCVVYVLLSPAIGARAALVGLLAITGAGGLLLVIDLQLPIQALVHDPERLLDLSGRGHIWLGYLDDFRAAPLFGRGLGASEHAVYQGLPHNEYLRLLVDGGLVGALVYATALLSWGRSVLERTRSGERAFVWALFCALAAYALTDNVLLMPAGALPFFYLAVMRIRSRSRSGRRRHRSASPVAYATKTAAVQ